MTGLDPEATRLPDMRAMPRECRGVLSHHEIDSTKVVQSQNRPTNRGNRHAQVEPGYESPSTAKCATAFGKLERLSGQSRAKGRKILASKGQPRSRDEVVHDLSVKSVSLWGHKRTQALRRGIEKTADQMLSVAENLPHFEEVPTLTWHDRP